MHTFYKLFHNFLSIIHNLPAICTSTPARSNHFPKEFPYPQIDIWRDVRWFNLNLTDNQVIEYLNKEFDNYYLSEKDKELEY